MGADMSANIDFHNVTAVYVDNKQNGETAWIDVTILQKDGTKSEITIWSDNGWNVPIHFGPQE